MGGLLPHRQAVRVRGSPRGVRVRGQTGPRPGQGRQSGGDAMTGQLWRERSEPATLTHRAAIDWGVRHSTMIVWRESDGTGRMDMRIAGAATATTRDYSHDATVAAFHRMVSSLTAEGARITV